MRPVRVLQAGAAVVLAGIAGGDAAALVALLVVSGLALASVVWALVPDRRHRLVPVGEVSRAERFPAYDRLYGAVLLSRSSARHVDLTLRPVLQHVLAADLEDAGEEAVRARVGERLWHVIDPGRPIASDSSSGGLTHHDLSEVLDRLEHR